MCGIAGGFAITGNGRIEKGTVEAMLSRMRHRGPDDEGLFMDATGRAVLGHRRLSIIDLGGGHQPMFNEDRSMAIVFNGEIYNFQELRSELESFGHRFRSNSDTEAIVHLYEQYGENCVSKLKGMFAFAIWDGVNGRLFLARDRFGKKPLFYTAANGKFWFGSEFNALCAAPDVSRELDYTALDLFLTLCYIPSPHSILKAVRKLPPAHTMSVDERGVTMRRYWTLDYVPKLDLDFEEAKKELRGKLEEAVRTRLVSDVPLGCFLSGGVDSSVVTAIMSGLTSEPVKTFSIGFPTSGYDERSYAQTVAERYHTDHHHFVVEAASVEVLPEIVKQYGEPFGDSSALPVWFLARMTRQHVTVALTGDGADEFFAGYARYLTGLRYEQAARRVPEVVKRSAAAAAAPFQRPTGLLRKLQRAARLLNMPSAPRFAALNLFLARQDKRRLYAPSFLAHVDSAAERSIEEAYSEKEGTDLDKMTHALVSGLLPDDFLVKVDIGTMAHSLEARSPFLDHELAEFTVKLPPEYRLNGRTTKHILKEAFKDYFPPGFLQRPKQGFQIPSKAWFRQELKRYTEDKILRGSLPRLGVFNMEAVAQMLGEHKHGRVNHETNIWNLLVLSLWAESNVG